MNKTKTITLNVSATALPTHNEWFSEFTSKARETENPTLIINAFPDPNNQPGEVGRFTVYLSGYNSPSVGMWFAELLSTFRGFDRPVIDLRVACESDPQSGQLRRRIGEKLAEKGVTSDQFSIHPPREEKSPVFMLHMPAITDLVSEEEEEEEEEEQHQVSYEKPQAQHPAIAVDKSATWVGEGDFLVVANAAEKVEENSREFTRLTWQIVIGGGREGCTFDDSVMTMPESLRAIHLARAFKTDSATLRLNPDSLRGRRVFDKRRESIKKNGQVEIANFYYPPEYAPTK